MPKYYKCIDVQNNKYLLMDGDGKTIGLSKSRLVFNIANEIFRVINLRVNAGFELVYTEGEALTKYKQLGSSRDCSESSAKAHKKAMLLNMVPCINRNVSIDGEARYTTSGGTYDEIVFTDLAINLLTDIKARKVVFIGENQLTGVRLPFVVHIRCTEAIIMNKCAMSNIAFDGSDKFKEEVAIHAKKIVISHPYIDINTIYEVAYIFRHSVYTKRKIETLKIIEIDFSKSRLTIDKIINTIEEIVNRVYTENNSDKKVDVHIKIARYSKCLIFLCSMIISLPKYKKEISQLAFQLKVDLLEMIMSSLHSLNNTPWGSSEGALGILDFYDEIVA